MASASWELQKAVYAALTADAALTGLLGGARVYDHVPRDAPLPYVTLGQTTARDWSTGSEQGEEHVFAVHVWSRAAGKKEAHEIMGAVRACLHEAPLAPAGHRLVTLRHELSDARREADGETTHGIVRFRAVTEPL